MKKCLCCENEIEKINHYVCSECFKKIKDLKEEFLYLSEKELNNEYSRWLRNKNFTRNIKYKNEYQMKVIAIAEIFKEKYNDTKKINTIIDFSNKQEIGEKTIKINEETEEENYHKEFAKKDKVDLDNIKTYKKCNDGHRVLSLSEQIIDNWLNEKQIRHYYDIEIDNSTAWRYDFFLPDYDIFIEFWGLETEKYHARKEAKLEYYKENDYKLISIENKDLSDINCFLRKQLENLGVFKKQKNK